MLHFLSTSKNINKYRIYEAHRTKHNSVQTNTLLISKPKKTPNSSKRLNIGKEKIIVTKFFYFNKIWCPLYDLKKILSLQFCKMEMYTILL